MTNFHLTATLFIRMVLAWGPLSLSLWMIHRLHCQHVSLKQFALKNDLSKVWQAAAEERKQTSYVPRWLVMKETHWDCSPGPGCGQERAGREINTLRLPLRRRSARPSARSFYFLVSPAGSGTCSAPCGDSAEYEKTKQCVTFLGMISHQISN